MQWKSPEEEIAFKRLESLLPSLKITELHDSHKALELLLRKRKKNGTWDWGVLEDFVTIYELEFSQQGKSYENGLKIIKELLREAFEVKKKKNGKLIDLQQEKWTPDDIAHLEKTLGVLQSCFKTVSDYRVAIFLMGLGLIVIYESKGGFARRRILSWYLPSIQDKKKREQIIEDFLVIDNSAADGKSDFFHIRNGFAHGHFEFKDDRTIALWDISDKGKETYRRELSVNELNHLIKDSQKKLELLEVYPNILIALEGLFQTFKKEWKVFRR